MQTARAYIFARGVDIFRNFGYLFDCILSEMQIDIIDRKKRGILRGYCVLRLC